MRFVVYVAVKYVMVRPLADFSSEALEAKRQKAELFEMLKEKNFQLRILFGKTAFQN